MKEVLQNQLPCAFLLNQAVFRINKRQFDAALTSYRQAKKLGVPADTAREAILWLDRAAEALNPAYSFGAAVLNDDHNDPALALEGYEACLELLPPGSKARTHAEERIRVLRDEDAFLQPATVAS